MIPQDPYVIKAIEYLLGITFLVLFALFWRYATGGRTAAAAVAARAPRRKVPEAMLNVPAGIMLHPGHTWARLEAGDVVAIGVDRFAQQIVGPIAGIHMPRPGDEIEQGDRAFSLDGMVPAVDLVAPVSGRVVALNERALENPHLLDEDPYDRGWLMKVRVPRFTRSAHQLLTGTAARHLMKSSWEELMAQVPAAPGVLPATATGPVDPAQWDGVARRLLLS